MVYGYHLQDIHVRHTFHSIYIFHVLLLVHTLEGKSQGIQLLDSELKIWERETGRERPESNV